MYARHVVGLTLRDVEFSYDKDDARPAFLLDDVTRTDVDYVRAQRAPGGLTFLLKGVNDFVLRNAPGLKDVRRERVEREGF